MNIQFMEVCTSLQTDNHDSTPPLSFLQARCPSCHPTNSVNALKATTNEGINKVFHKRSAKAKCDRHLLLPCQDELSNNPSFFYCTE